MDTGRIARSVGTGVGLGVGLGMVAGVVALMNVGGFRPIARGAVKGAIAARELALGVAAELKETGEDIYHEARAEREVERAARESHEAALEHKTIVIPGGR